MKQQNETINFEVIKQFGVLSEHSRGWKKEINLLLHMREHRQQQRRESQQPERKVRDYER